MNIVGFSSVKQLGNASISIGNTGPTGPIGNTGPIGLGLTGNTGSGIVGITLIDRYLVTAFSNGTTYSTPNKIYGATGGFTYIADFLNAGSGISIGYGITGSNGLILRPIRIVNNTANNLSVTSTSSDVTVNLATVGGAGVTLVPNSSFTDAYLLKFKNKKLKRIAATKGVTSGASSYYGLDFINSNLFERVRGMGWTGSTDSVNCVISGIGVTCDINPFEKEYDELMYGLTSKIFVGDFNGRTASINIATCPTDGNAYGFEMYIQNAKNPINLNNRFTSTSPIKWPLNRTPCFSSDGATCDIRVSFFGIQGIWYATAKHIGINSVCNDEGLFYRTCTSSEGFDAFIPDQPQIIGACCKPDGTCTETSATICTGYFHGIGTTCGSVYNSICNKPGACCVVPPGQLNFCFELTSSECLGISFSHFAGNSTNCSGVNCGQITERLGACCDGLGGCSQTTKTDCINNSGYFQGVGSDCVSKYTGLSICSGGTGPCCINGVCSTNSGSECLANNGYYLGTGRSCSEFVCPASVSCLGYVNGIPVRSGQEYGGGIIVGRFEPGKSKILGASSLFNPTNIGTIDGTTVFDCEFYPSFLDHTAYGITKDCGFNNEAYIIIVYPEDVVINGNKTFLWGITGSSWGPLLDSGGNYSDFSLLSDPSDPNSTPIQYYDTHLRYSEGFWSTQFTEPLQNLIVKTFSTCSSSVVYGNGGVARVFSKSPYGLHGSWHHSWGLYNTVRAISANNTYVKNVSLSGVFKFNEFEYTNGYNAFKAVRTIPDGLTSPVQGITANSASLSGWYLPSHDELAFIASSTANMYGFNINTHLMTVYDGEPLNGIYWTSTGTFDYDKDEGVYDTTTPNQKPKPGSVAIAMDMDVNGSSYKVYKSERTKKYKVRPVRMLRCDATIPQNRYLWLIPSVYESKINQRNIDTLNIEAI